MVAFFGALAGVVSWPLHCAERRRSAVRALQEAGVSVYCRGKAAPLPQWADRFRSDSFQERYLFEEVVAVDFPEGPINEAAVNTAVSLKHIETLWLDSTELTPHALAALLRFPRLCKLGVSYTNATDNDLANIATITTLCWLRIDATSITDVGVQHLRSLKRLGVLTADGCEITDAGLRALAEIESLRVLHIRRTLATGAGVRWIREQRPNLEVAWE